MLKVAIIGCGKIADQHATIIDTAKNCRLVGVCDSEPLMAMQLADRFEPARAFSDIQRMLDEARPDVVHITTPPLSHFHLGKICLENGCQVYMEKPLTLDATEAIDLIDLARANNLKITVGHNLQFSHASRRMRKLINSGYLGGQPVHMESYYCYDLSDPKYAMAILGDQNHWVRKLPGKLLHNLISHGISKIAEHISDRDPEIVVHGFPSKVLKRINEHEIVDEIRVIISSRNGPTAYFTCSTQMRPSLRHFRIFGPSNGIEIDEDNQSVLKIRGRHHKSFLNQFIPPFDKSYQNFKDVIYNGLKFIRSDFHPDAGMRHLIEAFYRSIRKNSPVPIAYDEIILTTRIMDSIFYSFITSRDHPL